MNKLSFVLKVKSIKETVKFYENFGFSAVVYVPEEEQAEFAILKYNDIELMIQQNESMESEYSILAGKENCGTFTMYITVDDIDSIYEKCKAEGFSIQRELEYTQYGNTQFCLLDNNGYIVEFAKRNHVYQ